MVLKKLFRKKAHENLLKTILEEARNSNKKRFLLLWNRGLGDIALGLYAIVEQIRSMIPEAEITFLTRKDLQDGFTLLGSVHVLVSPSMKRKHPVDIKKTLEEFSLTEEDFDVVLSAPDPTKWCKWQLSTLIPKMKWNDSWDDLCQKFDLSAEDKYIGVHVHSETVYGYEKNWPVEYWEDLFSRLTEEDNQKVILFGSAAAQKYSYPGLVDLRGKTTLFETLSVIKNRCKAVIAPDSGILSLVYYIDAPFPLTLISLWADPFQGVLKQNVISPNPLLRHIPFVAKKKDIRSISVEKVWRCTYEVSNVGRENSRFSWTN
ncbi:MAG: hypothetical protein HKM07_00300 [Chlamydiae bacterium]|nr:hypothetical protein [Chlamydiota bacterium]